MTTRESLRLVAEWFESDSGAGVGGKALSNNAHNYFVAGRTPWLPLKTDFGATYKDLCFGCKAAAQPQPQS